MDQIILDPSWVRSTLKPVKDATYDLGSSGKRFRDLYLSREIIFSVNDAGLRANTVDGADNLRLTFSGGGAFDAAGSRGASLRLQGNEASGAGACLLLSGNAAGACILGTNGSGSLFLRTNALDRWNVNTNGALSQDATNGGSIIMPATGTGVIRGASSISTDVTGITGGTPGFTSLSDNASILPFVVLSFGANTTGANITGFKTRAATGVATTIVNSGDTLLRLQGYGADGVTFRRAGSIQLVVDGTPSSGGMPGRWEFLTTPAGSATAAVRWSILNDGVLKNNTAGNESTGAGSAALGANCPAVTVSAPYTWIKLNTSDGSAVYVPVWK